MEINPIRGMKDLYGLEFSKYQSLVSIATKVSSKYGYQCIETPIIEDTAVFQRSLGDESDVVSKEMYSFTDKGGEHITLRPEGTAGVMRAIASNKLLVNDNNPIKLMYYGPMFRYDRPQKGRYRQFHQIGFEHVGEKSPYTDVLSIAMANEIFTSADLDNITVYINSLGGSESRKSYIKAIVEYFKKYENDLSGDSKRRLITNPLRILDSKVPTDIEICTDAPKIQAYLNHEDAKYFDTVIRLLGNWGIDFVIDPKLVRGLDYYTHTTFEFKRGIGEYQDALGGGGRYDGLLKLFCKNDVSGVGFAIGVERLMMLMHDVEIHMKKVAVIPVSSSELDVALDLTKKLLEVEIPTELLISESNLKKRVETATKRNFSYLLVIGEEEKAHNEVSVTEVDSKTLRNVRYSQETAILCLKEKFES